MHSTPTPQKKVDIVIINCYPQAYPPISGDYWALAEEILNEGGSVVLLKFFPLGTAIMHYHEERRRHLKRLAGYPIKKGEQVMYHTQGIFTGDYAGRPWPVKHAGQILVVNPNYSQNDILSLDPKVEWLASWTEAIKKLKAYHGEKASVAIYPCAPLQFDPEKWPLLV
jgi:hypothetical protein